MSVGCKQPGCSNLCSVFVYPYCYEHIESKISEHHHGAGQPQQGVYNHLYSRAVKLWNIEHSAECRSQIRIFKVKSFLTFFTNFEVIFVTSYPLLFVVQLHILTSFDDNYTKENSCFLVASQFPTVVTSRSFCS